MSHKTEMKENAPKIIYIFERRHGYSYDVDMFQMDVFTSRGYNVEVWSAVNWTFPGIEMPENHDRSGRTYYIDNEEMLRKELMRVKDQQCFFLVYPYHAYSYISYVIRKEIKKSGFEFCNFTESPAFSADSVDRKIISSYSKIRVCFIEIKRTLGGFIRIILYPLIRQRQKKKGKKPESFKIYFRNYYARLYGPLKYKSMFNFVTVKLLYDSFPNYFEIFSKRNVLVHSESYDEYMETKKMEPVINGAYIVYVDSYSAGHSDYKKLGIPFPVSNPEGHYRAMNALFDAIESELGIPVIIAAHPKAEYKGHEYDGREIVYFKTTQLIKDAQLVLVELSTCIGTICLFKKDFMILYSSEYFKNIPAREREYEKLTSLLKCQALDILDNDAVENWKKYVTIFNDKSYQGYLERYVISDGGVIDLKIFEVIKMYLEKVKR